jgi:hypothetical protein
MVGAAMSTRLLAIWVIALGGLSLLGHFFGVGFLIRTLPSETMAPPPSGNRNAGSSQMVCQPNGG